METIDKETLKTIGQIISYIITVVIGGVGYKFYQIWMADKSEERQLQAENNQKLIENLENRLIQVTNRTEILEKQLKEYHEREIDFIKELTKAQMKVEILEKRVKSLEEDKSYLKRINEKYYQKYGRLENNE